MTERNRTTATDFYGPDLVMSELDRLKFAVNSMVQLTDSGSYLRENMDNIARGIGARLDYLHDAVRVQAAKREQDIAHLERTLSKLRTVADKPSPNTSAA